MATIREYRPPVKEFFLLQSDILPNGSVKHSTAGPTILIVLEGCGSITHEQSNENIVEGMLKNYCVFLALLSANFLGSSFFFHPQVAFEVKNTGTSNLLIYEAIYQV